QTALLVFDDVGDAADGARYNGHAVAHGFEEHDAQAFGVAARIHDGREDQHIRFRIGISQSALRHAAANVDAGVETAAPDLRRQCLALWTIADHGEARLQFGREAPHRLDEVFQAFPLDETADEQDAERLVPNGS